MSARDRVRARMRRDRRGSRRRSGRRRRARRDRTACSCSARRCASRTNERGAAGGRRIPVVVVPSSSTDGGESTAQLKATSRGEPREMHFVLRPRTPIPVRLIVLIVGGWPGLVSRRERVKRRAAALDVAADGQVVDMAEVLDALRHRVATVPWDWRGVLRMRATRRGGSAVGKWCPPRTS